jgi:ELP3 family radical SAM enzyme/protein acetyltransferase
MESNSVVDMEDIVKPFWFQDLTEETTTMCYDYLNEYYYNRKAIDDMAKSFEVFQKKNKFQEGIIKFGYLIVFYKMARQDGRYPIPHIGLEKVLRVKNVRENSGVMVFSIFTSGYPYYTKVNADGTKEIVREFLDFKEGNGSVYLKYYSNGSVKILEKDVKEEDCENYYMRKDEIGRLIFVKMSEVVEGERYCYLEFLSNNEAVFSDVLKKNKQEIYYVVIDSMGMTKTLDGKYSCKYNCFYCPNFPNMPRSYLPGEPSVDRAIKCNFVVFEMITDRAKQYVQQGHAVDKAEVIIQGGTWDTYSYEYRTEFVRDIYYTFNVLMDYFFSKPLREPLTMEEEIKINETAGCRVIGLTPETRPDQINYKTIQFLRKIGATRVQLGIQHLDDVILRYVNRGCYFKETIRAIQMLKDCGFKISGHLMPDLPAPEGYEGKMPEVDKAMLEKFNTDPALKIDYVKVYPTVVTEHTEIKKWYDEGKYKPYGELKKMTPEEKAIYQKLPKKQKMELRLKNPLYKNVFEFYKSIHPSMRIERVFRDIPVNKICGGTTQSSFRSEMDNDLDILGELSNCIRYREAGNVRNKNRTDIGEPILKILEFEGSKGTEYFLSWESDDDRPVLYSFLRLRLSKNSGLSDTGKVIFPELVDCALIREVHTYGKATPCKENQKYYQNNSVMFSQDEENRPQHKGFGKKLIEKAEEISMKNGYRRISVIAGVGAREYYRKLGYTNDSCLGCYQIKNFDTDNNILKGGYMNFRLFYMLFILWFVMSVMMMLKYFFY